MSAVAGNVDLYLACALLSGIALAFIRVARGTLRPNAVPERVTALPAPVFRAGMRMMQPLVTAAVALGVSANMITASSLVAGAGAGLFLAWGHFGLAGALFVAASCGDALDGLVARATNTDSLRGALFDASVDRYEEFLAFGGLAMFFRSSGVLLALTLLAFAGAFMVSYGSALAEARRITVPPGLMRRPERAAILGAGIVLCPIGQAVSQRMDGAAWARNLPVILSLIIIAVVGNSSAIRRLRSISLAVTSSQPTRQSARRPAKAM